LKFIIICSIVGLIYELDQRKNIQSYPTKQIVMGVSTIGKYIGTRGEHTGSPHTTT